MDHQLEPMPDDWQRMLAVVAHPDDLEYGAASAIAAWTAAGRWVGYVIVGVDDVRFLGHPDGSVEPTLVLRRDLAREIRRTRPDVLLVATYALTYGLGPDDQILNQADHRGVGIAALDAARDAGNRWIFPELAAEGLDRGRASATST